jgi:hypothetical protein
VYYDNESDLCNLVEVYCDLIEVKFKSKILKFFKENYLNEKITKSKQINNIKIINLLLNHLMSKRTIMISMK